jgi:hypothetical protein
MEPADLDGQGLPPAGAPEHFFAAGGYQLRGIFEDDGLYSYKFHVDFADPSKSTFTGPSKITVSPYHFLCDGQLTQCVPQPGSTTSRDPGTASRRARPCGSGKQGSSSPWTTSVGTRRSPGPSPWRGPRKSIAKWLPIMAATSRVR